MHWKIVTALCALLMASPARAQANPDSVKMRNDCRFAAQVLTTGRPAPHLLWARGFIGYCGTGEWSAATRGAVLRLRTSMDNAELAREWRFVWMLRDADLFDAIVEIALDGNASVGARLWSLRTLAKYIDPEGEYNVGPPVRATSHGGQPECTAGQMAGRMASYAGKPLPMNFSAQARGVAQTLIADETQPVEIRNAARCVAAAPVYATVLDDTN